MPAQRRCLSLVSKSTRSQYRMTASQLHINVNTPLGATLISDGATFRAWAPAAREVYLASNHEAGIPSGAFPKQADDLLAKDAAGLWAGFVPGIKDGDLYRFYVVGTGSE